MGHYDSCYEADEMEAEKQANPDYKASQVFAKQAKAIKQKMKDLLSKYESDKDDLQDELDNVEWAQRQICPHLHAVRGYCADCGEGQIKRYEGE